MRSSMIINSLALENFKSYSKMNLDFNSGISIIMGQNGAGKSTILEAVSFALFKQYSGRSIQHLVRSEQTKMKVQLDFVVNARTYRVLRERGKSTSKAELRIKEGEAFHSLATGDKQVSYEIQNLLEMDGDLFLNAVYVRQGEIADLIDKTQSEKKQLIGKLLGIDSLEKSWKNMLPLIKDYESQKERCKGRIEGMGELKKDLEKETEKKTLLDDKIKNTQSKKEQILIEMEAIKRDKDEMDTRKIRFKEMDSLIKFKRESLVKAHQSEKELLDELKNIGEKEERIKEIEPELPGIKDLESLKTSISLLDTLNIKRKEIESRISNINKFQSILSENEPFFEEYNDIQKKINEINLQMEPFSGIKGSMTQLKINQKQIQDKSKKITHEIGKRFITANDILGTDFTEWELLNNHLTRVKSAAEIKLESLTTQINEKTGEISSLESLNKSMQKPLDELKTVEGQCPVCKSEIDVSKKNELVEGYLSDIESNTNSIKNIQSILKELNVEKTDLNTKYLQITSINTDILKERVESLADTSGELENIVSQMEDLQGKVTLLDEIEANLNSKKGRLEEIKANYERYIKVQGSLESAGNLDELNKEMKELLNQINLKEEEINNLTTKLGLSTVDIELIDTEISRLKKLNDEYQQIRGIVSKKESVVEKIQKFGAEILKITEEQEKAQQELEGTAYDEEIHENLINSFNDKNIEFQDTNGQEKEYSGELKGVLENINRIGGELGLYGKYQAELSSLDDFLKLLNLFRDLYGKDGIQKELRNMSRPLIEQNTREFFEKFNFEYSDITLDEDYNIDVYGPVGKTTLDMISGGERIAVALALRLGITKALSGGTLELIMLDEPTIHLDTYRRSELIDILKRMSIIPQMIIVTHDVDLEEAAENIIKVEKVEGISRVMVE
ncbi:MAG: DNA repair protein Rad50 [Methanobacteriales archaeon HGW-Methanobacteriales-1]|nr:MAG: DNA repair protein Rad50 [Methanobacteriales archaeon HGW-Methanobacteriales-1]